MGVLLHTCLNALQILVSILAMGLSSGAKAQTPSAATSVVFFIAVSVLSIVFTVLSLLITCSNQMNASRVRSVAVVVISGLLFILWLAAEARIGVKNKNVFSNLSGVCQDNSGYSFKLRRMVYDENFQKRCTYGKLVIASFTFGLIAMFLSLASLIISSLQMCIACRSSSSSLPVQHTQMTQPNMMNHPVKQPQYSTQPNFSQNGNTHFAPMPYPQGKAPPM